MHAIIIHIVFYTYYMDQARGSLVTGDDDVRSDSRSTLPSPPPPLPFSFFPPASLILLSRRPPARSDHGIDHPVVDGVVGTHVQVSLQVVLEFIVIVPRLGRE